MLETEFANELNEHQLEPIEVIKDLSIISVVGDGMKKAKGIAARFFSALAQANISIVAIAQGSSERSISAVVPQNKAIEAVKATHQALFNNKKSWICFSGRWWRRRRINRAGKEPKGVFSKEECWKFVSVL